MKRQPAISLGSNNFAAESSKLNADLTRAAGLLQIERVKELLENGADPNSQELSDTPLYVATFYDNLDLMEILLDKGADPTLPTPIDKGGNGMTPISLAARNNKLQSLNKMLERDPDMVDCKNSDGTTALHHAIIRLEGQLKNRGTTPVIDMKVVNLLLAFEANPNDSISQQNNLERPIHVASRLPDNLWQISEVLIQHGADPTVLDKHGNSPLHIAASRGNLMTAKALIKRGADRHLKNDLGHSPTGILEAQGVSPQEIESLDVKEAPSSSTAAHFADSATTSQENQRG